MIYELYIKNCALVEEIRIEFDKKLNILTGETGSGKSIILEALSLCLGGKYDRTFLRKGCSNGLVELVISSDNKKFVEMLKEYDIEQEQGEFTVVSRKLFEDGKSSTKINGKNIRLFDLKRVMSVLVDIHGQHQNQSLYSKEKYLEFLDLYGKNDILIEISEYRKIFNEFNEIKKEISKLNNNMSEKEIQRERDLLIYQIEEIGSVELDEEKYKELKTKKEVLLNSEKIYNTLMDTYGYLHQGEINSELLIGKSVSNLESISKYDSKLADIEQNVEKIMYDLQDLSYNIREYVDSIDFEPGAMVLIEEKLDLINDLRRKYGDTISDILEYYNDIQKKLNDIENREELNNELGKNLNEKEEKLLEVSLMLTEKRKIIAEKLEKNILKELLSLNIKNTKFKVMFNKVEYNDDGMDDVDFYVSFNLGEDLKPINKVASGGEMSRFMLGFKSLMSDIDKIETLIFDEIDTGISGRAAQIVGEKISEISKEKQVICITHLPQIAAFADTHFYIEKQVENNRTFTTVEKLDYDRKKNEIARLISGRTVTEKTIDHASEMIDSAKGKSEQDSVKI